jgi:hypothetical protein
MGDMVFRAQLYVLLTRYSSGDEIRECKIGGACSNMGENTGE